MICVIILSRENDKYVARAKEWPEVAVTENSREAAIDGLKSQLLDYLANQVEVIQIEIPLSAQTGNPWIDKFGCFKDDPAFDDLQVDIDAYRQELDEETNHLMK